MLPMTLSKISDTTHRDSGSGDRTPPSSPKLYAGWTRRYLDTFRPSSISNSRQFYKVAVVVEKGIFFLQGNREHDAICQQQTSILEFFGQFCSPSPHQGSLLSAKRGKEMSLPHVKQAKNYCYQAIVPVLEPLQSVEIQEDANSTSHVFPG